ncbi:insulin-like peptide receptor [Leptidea sinapis]|uniref:insulin-like peptide receptor n=1 Tax=Leptidea sinapis TaxID=189913 RepID=UPI00213A0D1B|nr:insulin-like peptide receptor [Leptidea sinapis]XP_050667013.1 insulin-like peptide receptor [Leptidea sinapis]XP_050667014.1 insulin-like peptide receptor [Leptidea sinapis]XP_050667015.1 insulin-like peptide receptor [Leptidea sinapis]XP_050667016.1 insulin-like peptide receptor [Leptidea sinapis]
MATRAIVWLTICVLISCGSSSSEPSEYHGLCTNMFCNRLSLLRKLQNCTIVLGDLNISLLERTKRSDFKELSFPNLKEVTGFVVVYRVAGLESLGQLFPNLMRIRGNTLMSNYALIIYDMPKLREVGLYNLLKIDRGGVIIWTGPLTCYLDTINWKAIAPNSRHVLSDFNTINRCKNIPCTCSTNASANFCWNNRKCQRFLEGPEAEKCSQQCVGCRRTNSESCSLCRHYTYKNDCVSKCPPGTIVLVESNYCVTGDECRHMGRLSWNNTCVADCPENYVKSEGAITDCVPCENCHKTCSSLILQTLASIQAAARCVRVNGSITIHIRTMPEAMSELRYYLKSIKEVSDYIVIYGSIVITSLDFLPALQKIEGQTLFDEKYSFVVYDMENLQTLFTANVTNNLKVNQGSLRFYRNPMLCESEIEKIRILFPTAPSELDIPEGLNGYSGGCDKVSLNLTVEVKNETSVTVKFHSEPIPDIQYSILYVIVPRGLRTISVPETCSETDWDAINIHSPINKEVEMDLSALHPATSYAICIEKYDPLHRHLSRSDVKHFSTAVGKPEPPFIIELVASSSESVVIRWVDHLAYQPHIVRYELDVVLVNIKSSDILARNHCTYNNYEWLDDYTVHAKIMRPPKNYDAGCESMCGILSTVTMGALVDEHFDVCNIVKRCDFDDERPKNSSTGSYIKTLALNISGPKKDYQIVGLAAYRDYRFKLKACTKSQCSQSVTNTVKTLRSDSADIALISFVTADEKGIVTVKWDSPRIINGAVLSYIVEVYPVIKFSDVSQMMPHTVCVSGNVTDLVMKSVVASKYLVRLCTKTLASTYSCGEKEKIVVAFQVIPTWWWSGIFFGIFIYSFSCVIGWRWRSRNIVTDDIPLVDATSLYRNESEPPAVMMSDFAPIYNIPLTDS